MAEREYNRQVVDSLSYHPLGDRRRRLGEVKQLDDLPSRQCLSLCSSFLRDLAAACLLRLGLVVAAATLARIFPLVATASVLFVLPCLAGKHQAWRRQHPDQDQQDDCEAENKALGHRLKLTRGKQ